MQPGDKVEIKRGHKGSYIPMLKDETFEVIKVHGSEAHVSSSIGFHSIPVDDLEYISSYNVDIITDWEHQLFFLLKMIKDSKVKVKEITVRLPYSGGFDHFKKNYVFKEIWNLSGEECLLINLTGIQIKITK